MKFSSICMTFLIFTFIAYADDISTVKLSSPVSPTQKSISQQEDLILISTDTEEIKINEELLNTYSNGKVTAEQFKTALTNITIDDVLHFDSPEHKLIGDGIDIICDENDTINKARECLLKLDNGVKLTFGDVIYLSGDFYGIPYHPIADNNTRFNYDSIKAPINFNEQDRFNASFAILNGKENNLEYSASMQEQIEKWTNNTSNEVNLLQNIVSYYTQALKQAKKLCGDDVDCLNSYEKKVYESRDPTCEYYVITGGESYQCVAGMPWVNMYRNTSSRYIMLSMDNTDHFGFYAFRSYIIGHTIALNLAKEAREAKLKGNSKLAFQLLQKAYAKDAFSLHFLTDLFAAGHVRTPRDSLSKISYTFLAFTGLLTKAQHDEDGDEGLLISNFNGDSWTAYGDQMYSSYNNHKNAEMAVLTTQISANEITDVYLGKKKSLQISEYQALNYTPIIPKSPKEWSGKNHGPLFYVTENNKIMMRKDVSKIDKNINLDEDYTENWNVIWAIYDLYQAGKIKGG